MCRPSSRTRPAPKVTSLVGSSFSGTDYELRRIDFTRTEQQSSDYLKVNPKARVPAMVTPHGILTETPAMLAFIAQSFPEAELAPLNDAFAFAELQSFNSYLCSLTPIECVGTAG